MKQTAGKLNMLMLKSKENTMDELLFEKIDAYALDRLPWQDKEAFEAALSANKKLQQEAISQRQLIQNIQTESVRQLLEKVYQQNFEQQVPVIPMKKKIPFPYLSIAASLLLLMVAGLWFFNLRPADPTSLYTNYFTPATGLPTTLGYDQNAQFSEGMVSYKLGNYQEAIQFWQPLLEYDLQNDTLNFYIGISWLGRQQADKAIVYLEKVENSTGSIFLEAAQWYLALSYLEKHETNRAKKLLQQLTAGQGEYQQQSIALLKEL